MLVKVYDYDLTRCTGIDGSNELVSFEQAIDFIGDNVEKYCADCEKNKVFD